MIVAVSGFWQEALTIWLSGGWAMIALGINAMCLFALGMHVFLRLKEKKFEAVPETTWRRWIDHPAERQGPIGGLLDFVTGGKSLKQTEDFFQMLHTTEIVPVQRDLKVMNICVSAAPLLGLLGTVTGMLATFGALSKGSGGEKTMGMVASGISEALITTETGLIIALTGLFFHYQLARKHDKYRAFLAHLESVCNQMLYRQLQEEDAGVA